MAVLSRLARAAYGRRFPQPGPRPIGRVRPAAFLYGVPLHPTQEAPTDERRSIRFGAARRAGGDPRRRRRRAAWAGDPHIVNMVIKQTPPEDPSIDEPRTYFAYEAGAWAIVHGARAVAFAHPGGSGRRQEAALGQSTEPPCGGRDTRVSCSVKEGYCGDFTSFAVKTRLWRRRAFRHVTEHDRGVRAVDAAAAECVVGPKIVRRTLGDSRRHGMI